MRRIPLLAALMPLVISIAAAASADPVPELASGDLHLRWGPSQDGWKLTGAVLRSNGGDRALGEPSGEYTLLYSATAPSAEPLTGPWTEGPAPFPGPTYHGANTYWKQATGPVAMNTAGEALRFFPEQVEPVAGGGWSFSRRTAVADIRAEWRPELGQPGDIGVTLTVTARRPGFFSLATPTLTVIAPSDLTWAMVPGVFAGRKFESDLVRAYAYGQGLPERPVLARERTASTLLSLASLRSGATLAVIAEPGTATDPWASDHNTRPEWRLGLSHLNRRGQVAPTLYHPVLGQQDSWMVAGETRTFRFRYTARAADWFAVVDHAAYDVYRLREFLDLKQPERSLSERLIALRAYATDPIKSKWRTAEYHGVVIGAQDYGSIATAGVLGSERDAIKNSDYGALWMLASLTGDPRLTRDRLPYARAFKLEQQQTAPGFFSGAAIGQYYLWKAHRFTEEWGDYVEPVGLTYYTLCDLGNILLFSPHDPQLRQRLRLGADRLLAWQHPDGHWEVAYDRATERPRFTDLRDYRPTFYGLLVAYRVLGDHKYLEGARRGADWLIREAVEPGRFLGVCGDNRFAPDFATGQIAEGLEQLFEATGEPKYRTAAIATARFYVTSIYTHPAATRAIKRVNGVARQDWEINQSGLSFEHGGTFGSANGAGPILLASHAGLFIRMYRLTGDRLFRDLARAGVLGRDAFLDPTTGVASYYWVRMNAGAGPYPHHAWWQIGWITDYLLSEAALRSGGQIAFPRGFFTPKVGPHTSYGFAPGTVFGEPASLAWGDVRIDRPDVDAVTARRTDGRRTFIILMSESDRPLSAHVAPDSGQTTATVISASGVRQRLEAEGKSWLVELPAYGLAVLALDNRPLSQRTKPPPAAR